MWFLRFINSLLGALYYIALNALWIALATVAMSLSVVVDVYRFRGGAIDSILFILAAPFLMVAQAIGMVLRGLAEALLHGVRYGFVHLLASTPVRLWNFFKHKLFFGRKKEESVQELFNANEDRGQWESQSKANFFDRMAYKFLSLIFPMEYYFNYKAKSSLGLTGANVYYTTKILQQLRIKYPSQFNEKVYYLVSGDHPLTKIKAYLQTQKLAAEKALQEARSLPAKDDKRAGTLASAKERLSQIEASLRCVKRFENSKHEYVAINIKIACTSSQALCAVWTAIETEGKDETSKEELRYKLSLALYQIQRGYNLASGMGGVDLPECSTAALGLLMRVIANEPERMPAAAYLAQDPSRATLSEALKECLDRPFKSKSSTSEIQKLLNDPVNLEQYKAKRTIEIKALWRHEYSEFLNPKVGRQPSAPAMTEAEMDTIIDAGVSAWVPSGP